MKSPNINLRIPPALLAQIDAGAVAEGVTRSEWMLRRLEAGVGMDAPNPTPRAPVNRPAAAREALAAAEGRTGVRSVMDSLPLGNTRAPYQRARDKVGR